jgi:hypothetical protein
MKVSQSGKCQELLKFLQVQSQKPKTKLALMRTATGKADAELPLLQRISSLELTAPQKSAINCTSDCSPNKSLTEFK